MSAFFSGALLSTQQKAALDLFDRRYGIYEIVHKAVDQMVSSSVEFDQSRESEFLQAMERAYFFFGKDVENYFEQLWSDILDVRAADTELSAASDPDTRRDSGETGDGFESYKEVLRFRAATILAVHATLANCWRTMVRE